MRLSHRLPTAKMNEAMYFIKAKSIREECTKRMNNLNFTLNSINIGQNLVLHQDFKDKEDLDKAIQREKRKNRKLKKILKMKEDQLRAIELKRFGGVKSQKDLEQFIAAVEEEDEALENLASDKATQEIARDKAIAEQKMMKQLLGALQLVDALSQQDPLRYSLSTESSSVPLDPITQRPMVDPVIVDSLTHCGHTFEKESIGEWIKQGGRTCPSCNSELRSNKLTPNVYLREMISSVQESSQLESSSYLPLPGDSEQPSVAKDSASRIQTEQKIYIMESLPIDEPVSKPPDTGNALKLWIKGHKRKLIVTGVGLLTLVALLIALGGTTDTKTEEMLDSGPPASSTPPPTPTEPTDAPAPTPRECTWPDLRACDASKVLAENGLTGTIPTEIGLWTQLTLLNLRSNQLTGMIPSEIGLLTLMTKLNLSSNQLSGSLPTKVGWMTALHNLELEKNKLTGQIPSEIGLLSELRWLSLSENGLTGTVPTELGLESINTLYLYENRLSGTIGNEICSEVSSPWVDCKDVTCACCFCADGYR